MLILLLPVETAAQTIPRQPFNGNSEIISYFSEPRIDLQPMPKYELYNQFQLLPDTLYGESEIYTLGIYEDLKLHPTDFDTTFYRRFYQYEIPEPSCLTLLCVGFLLSRRWRSNFI